MSSVYDSSVCVMPVAVKQSWDRNSDSRERLGVCAGHSVVHKSSPGNEHQSGMDVDFHVDCENIKFKAKYTV